jgi:hypothetical protein
MGNGLAQDQKLKTDNEKNDRQHISTGGKQYFGKIIYEFHDKTGPLFIRKR